MKKNPLKSAKCCRASVILAAAVASLSFGNVQAKAPRDLDGDGIPNIVDPDVDNDGIPNGRDRNVDGGIAQSGPCKGRYIGDHLKNNAAKEKDIDGDGLADDALGETDIDGDGKKDASAKEPDIDGDGKADNSPTETDIDGDGKADDAANEFDIDGDGLANDSLLEKDIDGDGKANNAANEFDGDGDGIFNSFDADDDGDGVTDAHEGAFSAGAGVIKLGAGSLTIMGAGSVFTMGAGSITHSGSTSGVIIISGNTHTTANVIDNGGGATLNLTPDTPAPPPTPASSSAVTQSSWGGVLQIWNWSGAPWGLIGGGSHSIYFGDPALPPYQFNVVNLNGSAYIGGELVPVGYSAPPQTNP